MARFKHEIQFGIPKFMSQPFLHSLIRVPVIWSKFYTTTVTSISQSSYSIPRKFALEIVTVFGIEQVNYPRAEISVHFRQECNPFDLPPCLPCLSLSFSWYQSPWQLLLSRGHHLQLSCHRIEEKEPMFVCVCCTVSFSSDRLEVSLKEKSSSLVQLRQVC